MIDVVGKLRRLTTRVNALVSRSVVSLVNDAMKTQRLQLRILSDELEDDVEHMQPYGLSFVPPDGSEAIALAVRGDRDHTIAFCVQNPDERPTGNPPRTGGFYTSGEWRLFIDQQGKVHLGAQVGAGPVARADKVDAEFKRLADFLANGWVPKPAPPGGSDDGAASLQAAAALAMQGVQSTAAENAFTT